MPLFVCLAALTPAHAQDPVGAIEGLITDSTDRPISAAHVAAKDLDTGFTRETITGTTGLFRLPLLPVGRYRVTVEAPQFATLTQEPIAVNISQTVRV